MSSVNATEIVDDEIKAPYQAYGADLPLTFLFLFIILIIILYYIFYLYQSSKLSRVSGTGALCDTHDEFTNSRLAVYVFQMAAFIFGYFNAITFFIVSWSFSGDYTGCNLLMSLADVTWHLCKGFLFLSLISRARLLTIDTEYEIRKVYTKMLAFTVLVYMTFTASFDWFELNSIHIQKEFITDNGLRTGSSSQVNTYSICGEDVKLWVGILYIVFELLLCNFCLVLFLYPLNKMISNPQNQKLLDLYIKYTIFTFLISINMVIFTAIWMTNTFSMFRYFDTILNIVIILFIFTKCNGVYKTLCSCPHKCLRNYCIDRMKQYKKDNFNKYKKNERRRKITKLVKYKNLSDQKSESSGGIMMTIRNSFRPYSSNTKRSNQIGLENPFNTIRPQTMKSMSDESNNVSSPSIKNKKSVEMTEIKEDEELKFELKENKKIDVLVNTPVNDESSRYSVTFNDGLSLFSDQTSGNSAGDSTPVTNQQSTLRKINSEILHSNRTIRTTTFGGAQVDESQKLPISDLDNTQVKQLLNENLAIDIRDFIKGSKREYNELKSMVKNLRVFIDETKILLPPLSPSAVKNVSMKITKEEKEHINDKYKAIETEREQDKIIKRLQTERHYENDFKDDPTSELTWPGASRKWGQVNKLYSISRSIRKLNQNDFLALWNLFDKNGRKFIDTQQTLSRLLGALFLIFWKERNELDQTELKPPKWKDLKPLFDLMTVYIRLDLPKDKKSKLFRADFINNIDRYFLSAVERREGYLRKRKKSLAYQDDTDSEISIRTADSWGNSDNNNNDYDAIDLDNNDQKIEEEKSPINGNIQNNEQKNDIDNNPTAVTEHDLLNIGRVISVKKSNDNSSLLSGFKDEIAKQMSTEVKNDNNSSNNDENKHNNDNGTMIIKDSTDFSNTTHQNNGTIVVNESMDLQNGNHNENNSTTIINGSNDLTKQSQTVVVNESIDLNGKHSTNDTTIINGSTTIDVGGTIDLTYKNNNNNNNDNTNHAPSDTTIINGDNNTGNDSPKGNAKLKKLFNVDNAPSSSDDENQN